MKVEILVCVLLSVYGVLLIISLLNLNAEAFQWNDQTLMTQCFGDLNAATDVFTAGRMFKYTPLREKQGTCFYYAEPNEVCASNVNGLTYTTTDYALTTSWRPQRACVYSRNVDSPSP